MRSNIAMLVITVLLVGCDHPAVYSQADMDLKNSEIADLQSQLVAARESGEELQSRLDDLENASAGLQADVDRLQSENWQDVVPDIEDSSQAVDDAQSDAAEAAEEVQNSLE